MTDYPSFGSSYLKTPTPGLQVKKVGAGERLMAVRSPYDGQGKRSR